MDRVENLLRSSQLRWELRSSGPLPGVGSSRVLSPPQNLCPKPCFLLDLTLLSF